MSTIYVMEAANLFCGDDDPTQSKHLTLDQLKLPVLQEKQVNHHPGGSLFEIQMSMGHQALEATFNLKGLDPQLLGQFGLGSRIRQRYTAHGVVRDKKTNRAIETKAIMEGRLSKNEMDAFRRGEFIGHDYMIGEIMHYELFFDGAEKIYWDFFTQEWRVDGRSENADERRILRLAGL